MFNRLSTNTVSWILIIGVILLAVEVFFFRGGMIVSAFIAGLITYFGWKRFSRTTGKIIFWIGLAWLAFSVLNTLAVRFILVACIVLFILDYNKSRNFKERLNPNRYQGVNEMNAEQLVKVEPLFDSRLFGEDRTDDQPYKFRDINIHSLYGDKIVDLGNTILPDDVAVISIRQLVGNIVIYVPYDVEVSIHHNSVFGRAYIFGEFNGSLVNKSLQYETERYGENILPRVKIITSLISGDIEVRRI